MKTRQPNDAFMERVLFGSPLLYRVKRFMIEEVIWKWILSGLFRLAPNPIPDADEIIGGKRILLAACGPGDVTTGPSCDAAAEVTAFDIAPNFVTACRQNHPDWKVYCGDILRIPFPDGTFEVAVIYSMLHHVPTNASLVLAELARVTSGRILIVEGLVPDRGLLRRMLLLWYAIVDGGVHYYTRTELQTIFDKLGLSVERATQHGPIRHMMYAVLKTRPV